MSIEQLTIQYKPILEAILKQSNQGLIGLANNDENLLMASIYSLRASLETLYTISGNNNTVRGSFLDEFDLLAY
jgi:hypothetical protein